MFVKVLWNPIRDHREGKVQLSTEGFCLSSFADSGSSVTKVVWTFVKGELCTKYRVKLLAWIGKASSLGRHVIWRTDDSIEKVLSLVHWLVVGDFQEYFFNSRRFERILSVLLSTISIFCNLFFNNFQTCWMVDWFIRFIQFCSLQNCYSRDVIYNFNSFP